MTRRAFLTKLYITTDNMYLEAKLDERERGRVTPRFSPTGPVAAHRTDRSELVARLPHGTANYLVLRAISRGSLYGFDIMDATGLKSGQVYRALSKLEESRWVKATWEDPDIGVEEGRPRRRYYRLTPAGEKELRRTARRFQELAEGVPGVAGDASSDPAPGADAALEGGS